MKTCKCYVRTLPDYTQFALRLGVHALGCDAYRGSLDPVDAIEDTQTRDTYLRSMCTHTLHRDSVDCGHRSVACHVDCPCCTDVYTYKAPTQYIPFCPTL